MDAVRSDALAPVLLSRGEYHGTLAAARLFAQRGVPVVMAEWRAFAPALWSRAITRRVRCPPLQEPGRFVEWLLRFGERHPGYVLCATCDDLAWLYALHAEPLSAYFRLYQAPEDVVWHLLDKCALHAACEQAGIATPRSWFPCSEADLESIGGEATFPLLIKPRTHVLSSSSDKGIVVSRRADLLSHYRRLRAKASFAPLLAERHPEALWPMVQEFIHAAPLGVDSVAGFVTPDQRMVVRAATKVLQRPRVLGIGLCFEAAETTAEIRAAAARLCRSLGYHGPFEIEWMRSERGPLLIDFNPRFYHQMSFDIARGLPLPMLFYYAATGQERELEATMDASGHDASTCRAHGDRVALELMLAAQRFAPGAAPEAEQWRAWWRQNAPHLSQPTADWRDPAPFVLDAMQRVIQAGLHPLHFVRSSSLNPRP